MTKEELINHYNDKINILNGCLKCYLTAKNYIKCNDLNNEIKIIKIFIKDIKKIN